MTTIGSACGQLQSILKFRSSLFKGLRSVRQSLTKRDLFYAFMLNFCKEYIVCTLFAIAEEKIKTTHENTNDSHTEKKKNCCSEIGRTI